MKDLADVILRTFPNDERMGFFVKPNLPSTKLGKVLNAYTRLQPGDILAFHLTGGLLSTDSVALTATAVHYDKGFFTYEDLKGANAQGKNVVVQVNQNASLVNHTLKADTAEAATILARVLDTLAGQEKAPDLEPASYVGFSKEAVQWLEIRDEVMRTIDLLHERFQSGKLSLLEYEEKKTDLLSRL
jgi:hypothetical protein